MEILFQIQYWHNLILMTLPVIKLEQKLQVDQKLQLSIKQPYPPSKQQVTVNETTSSIDQSALQPLQNPTLGDVPVDLSGIENKTVLQPTGEAQTTMLNKTTVPFEQTTVEGLNQTEGQQQGG